MPEKIDCLYHDTTHVDITVSGVADTLHTAHNDAGQYATPGQMLAAALGACTLTMIGAVAARTGHKMEGARVSVLPVFAPDMSGLKAVTLHITLPPGTPDDVRARCLAAAQVCPVHRSLRPDIEFTVQAD